MSTHMLRKRCRLREMLSTLLTQERSMAGMRLQMTHDLLFAREALLAGALTVAPVAVVVTLPAPYVRESEVLS